MKQSKYQMISQYQNLGKNAQIAAKKISEKYRLIRQANAKKKFKLPGEIVTIDTIKSPQGDVKFPVSVPKQSSQKAAKRIKDKYAKIRQNKAKSKKIVQLNKRNKILKEIDTIGEIRTASDKKRIRITAVKILKKYKNMKKPKKTYLLNEKDIETIDYIEPQVDLFTGESIVNATYKILKKGQEKELKKGNQIAATNILKKYKILKKPKKKYLVNEEDIETINYDDEPQEDLFAGESILAAANKALDFDKFKQEQERALQQYNDQLMNDAETINYVDDINLEDVKDNKNLKIAAKKISDKYRKLRKRKATVSVPKLHKISETFAIPDKKGKTQIDKAVLIAAKNMSKKCKKLYG